MSPAGPCWVCPCLLGLGSYREDEGTHGTNHLPWPLLILSNSLFKVHFNLLNQQLCCDMRFCSKLIPEGLLSPHANSLSQLTFLAVNRPLLRSRVAVPSVDADSSELVSALPGAMLAGRSTRQLHVFPAEEIPCGGYHGSLPGNPSECPTTGLELGGRPFLSGKSQESFLEGETFGEGWWQFTLTADSH